MERNPVATDRDDSPAIGKMLDADTRAYCPYQSTGSTAPHGGDPVVTPETRNFKADLPSQLAPCLGPPRRPRGDPWDPQFQS